MDAADISLAAQRFPGAIATNVPLGNFTSWRIGGVADVVFCPGSDEELTEMWRWITSRGQEKILTIGMTSNLLFSDDGVRAPIIHIGRRYSRVVIEGETIRAEAGAWVPGLARAAMQSGLTGLEHISGIPGTLGGLIYMNGGSLRRSISEAVENVKVLVGGMTSIVSNGDCGFSYRHSSLQVNGAIVMGAKLRLIRANTSNSIRREMLEVMRARDKKFPRKFPNCGSVFISDEPIYRQFGPPGKLLEDLGLKGSKMGGAEISSTHANFIINRGDAKATDVLGLIAIVRERVMRETGFLLRVEPKYVTPAGSIEQI